MTETVFLAGAAGVIGQRLVPLLIAAGWRVFGTTRSAERAEALRVAGAEPVLVDVYDASALTAAVVAARPRVVMHQLTDLPRGLEPSHIDEARARNARMREEGTRNLVAAAVEAGAEKLVAQSIAFACAPGPKPYLETSPLDVHATGGAGINARGVASLEAHVLAAPLVGIVLRYGRFYGPGTGVDAPAGPGSLHVDDAAQAALVAMTTGERGIYNIVEDDGFASVEKAARGLGWRARGCDLR